MFRAEFETSHFSFKAYGATERDARVALMSGLAAHAKQYNLPRNWYAPDDFNVYAIDLKCAYRDRSLISGGR